MQVMFLPSTVGTFLFLLHMHYLWPLQSDLSTETTFEGDLCTLGAQSCTLTRMVHTLSFSLFDLLLIGDHRDSLVKMQICWGKRLKVWRFPTTLLKQPALLILSFTRAAALNIKVSLNIFILCTFRCDLRNRYYGIRNSEDVREKRAQE